MTKSAPVLAHQEPEGIDGKKYESLEILMEPFMHLSLNALPDPVRKRVEEDEFLCMFWDSRPDQRRSLANQHDQNNDPVLRNSPDAKAGMHIGYLGVPHVQAWLTMGAVTPQNAALLLFGENPSKYKVSLPDMGPAFDLMKWSFEDAARDGRDRNLSEWITVARARNLHGIGIDSWEACIKVKAFPQGALMHANSELQAAPEVKAIETKEQRQDRRLKACIDAGLPMDTRAALLRLPDGVGNVADCENVTRQAFSTDVKAALKRRESAIREGRAVHRA